MTEFTRTEALNSDKCLILPALLGFVDASL